MFSYILPKDAYCKASLKSENMFHFMTHYVVLINDIIMGLFERS